MAERTPIKKSTRFEVFKRDRFTCQYCGKKAPDVVLNIDHIEPVAGGGGNEILNLITSCFDCNNGKRDKKLDDNSVIEKQRKQLELLQERREQIELMFEWKKSLSAFDDDVLNMVVAYLENTKIAPFTLSETGKDGIKNLLKKFEVSIILDGVDQAAKSYLKRQNDDSLSKDSVEEFLDKLGGVIAVSQMPPIQQKLSYIKGICKKSFNYWDNRKGSIILNDYVSALREHSWSDEQILKDLDSELMPLTKDARNWSNWKNGIEKWIEDIKKWDKDDTISDEIDEDDSEVPYIEFSEDEVKKTAAGYLSQIPDKLKVLCHLCKEIPSFDAQVFEQKLNTTFKEFIQHQLKRYASAHGGNVTGSEEDVSVQLFYSGILDVFEIPKETPNYSYIKMLLGCARTFIEEMFSFFYLPNMIYVRSNVDIFLQAYCDHFNIEYDLSPPVYNDDLPF